MLQCQFGQKLQRGSFFAIFFTWLSTFVLKTVEVRTAYTFDLGFSSTKSKTRNFSNIDYGTKNYYAIIIIVEVQHVMCLL